MTTVTVFTILFQLIGIILQIYQIMNSIRLIVLYNIHTYILYMTCRQNRIGNDKLHNVIMLFLHIKLDKIYI